MSVSMVQEPGCLVKLEISLTPQASKAAYVKAIKSINKEVTLPGFRKGRAPDDLVLTHYNKYVEDEWKDILLNTAFQEAVELVKFYPLNKNATKQPSIKEMSRETGSRFTIEFETAPSVPEIHPENFQLLKLEAKEITEKEIADFIEEVRIRSATWEDISDREIQEGDFVDLTIENLDEPGMMICERTRFEVSDKMARWMHRLLIGLEVKASVEGCSEKDDTHACTESCGTEGHHHHHEEFKPTNCRITVDSIKKPTLPEVDEDFAQKTTGESLEKFHENIKKKLERDAESERENEQKEDLRMQIEKSHEFDIPKSFASGNRHEENAQLRLFFIADKFAKKHHIHVNNSEIYQAALQEVMEKGPFAEDLIHGEEKRVDAIRSILYTNILIEKALNKLLELVKETKKD